MKLDIIYGLEQTMRRSRVNSRGRRMITQYRSPIGAPVNLKEEATIAYVCAYILTEQNDTILTVLWRNQY